MNHFIRSPFIAKRLSRLLLCSLTFLFTACGSSKFDGVYENDAGTLTIKGNKVRQDVIGSIVEVDAEVSGDELILLLPQGRMVLKAQPDGSLKGYGGRWSKQAPPK